MIDLSFLTEEEQEAIMKVLQRDAELKRAEEERVRHLPEKVKDDVQLKNMSGQWFYEAKSKRHRDKIHGADIIRASMRRKPATIAEVSQNKTSKTKNSWVSNVNKEVFVPPALHGIVEQQEEDQLKTSSSSKAITSVLDNPEEKPMKAAVPSIKKRRNPFNSTALDDDLNSGDSENRLGIVPQLSEKEIFSLSEESPPKSNLQNDETEKQKKPSLELTDESQKGLVNRPVPKARKLIHKATDPVLQREDFVPKPTKQTEKTNGISTPPRGILKRSSSSSSTDSEVRISQTLDVQKKNGLSTATIFEGDAEKSSLVEEAVDSTQISLEKLKQVRFSSSTNKGLVQGPQLHHSKEGRDLDLLESNQKKSRGNNAIQSDSFEDKQISAVKPLGTYSSALQMKKIDGLQEDTSASGPCDTNGSLFLVNESLQTKTVALKKFETPQKTSSNIQPNSNSELIVDKARENKSNQILSHESKSHKNLTDEHQLSAKSKACEVSNTNSISLQQGKPDLVEERYAKTSFKPDKYADELMKMADESVSKVLDWFKRSSDTEDGEHVSTRSQDRESEEKVEFSTKSTVPPTENSGPSMHGKTGVTEELPFGKMKQPNSISSTSFTSEDVQLIKEGMKPKKGEVNKEQNHKSLSEFDCTRIEEKQEIKEQNQKSNLLQHQEHKLQPQKCESEKAIQERRRIREIRAFWERDKTIPSHGEKVVSINTSASGGCVLKDLGESDKIKATAVYLDNELCDHSKNTLRNALISCVSQASRNKHHSFEFGPGHAFEKPERTLPSDEVHEYTELPKDSNLQFRAGATSASPKSKNKDEKETLKGKAAACSQQKTSFQVFSLKEKMNEKSNNQISDPSWFQNLRNFWDTGVKFQSRSHRGDISLPNNINSITYESKTKEEQKGRDNVSKQELIQQQTQTSERQKPQKLDSMVGKKSLGSPILEGLNVTHTKNTDPVQLGRKPVVSKSQEKMDLSEQVVKEKSIAFSKDHHVSLQLPQSPGDNDALKETAVGDRLCLPKEKLENKTTPLNICLPKEEVAETVEKVVLPKGELNVFKSSLKKLENEASEMSFSLNLNENILKGTTFHSNQSKVFEQRGEESYDISPAGQEEEISKSTGKVNVPSTDEQENTKSIRKLFREFEPLCLQHQAADKDDSLEGSGLQNVLRETFVSELSEYRNMEMKVYQDINSISQTNSSVESTCQEATDQPEEVPESTEKSVAPSKVSGLSSVLEKLLKEATETLPPKPKHPDSTEWSTAEVEVKSTIHKHDRELPEETDETIEKSIAPSNVSGLSSALEKLLKEASEIPPPKPKHAESTVQRISEVEAKGIIYEHYREVPREINEMVEKFAAPSKDSGLRSALEKLLKEASETPPPKTKCPESTVHGTAEMKAKSTTSEHSEEVLQEISEMVEKAVAPSKVSGLSSALEKLLKEASEIPPPKPKCSDSTLCRTAEVEAKSMTHEHDREVLQDISEMVEKSVAPFKDSGLHSALEKLLKEASETPPPKPKCPESTVHGTAEMKAKSTTSEHSEEVLQEISEMVEKSVASSKVSSLNSALEKLLREASEIPPPKPKRSDSTVWRTTEMEAKNTTSEHNGEVLKKMGETTEKSTLSVAEYRGSGVNFQKLPKEVSGTPASVLEYMDQKMQGKIQTSQSMHVPHQRERDHPQEIKETIERTSVSNIAKFNEFSCSLAKLLQEASEVSCPISKELHKQEKFKDHTFPSEKETLFMTRLQPYNALSSYHTQIKLDIKGGPSEQNVKASVNDLAVSKIETSDLKREEAINKIEARNMAPVGLTPLEGKTNMSEIKTFKTNRRSEESTSLDASEHNSGFQALLNFRRASTPLKDDNNSPQPKDAQVYLMSQHEDNEEEGDSLNLGSKFSKENSDSHSGTRISTCSEEELNPVLMALKRSADRKKPSKSLEDIPSATSNKEKINNPKEELALSDEDVSTVPSQPDKLFYNPEKLKGLSKSVPSFLQEESDDRETDTASESSYSFGRIKKSPSSLTNLSSSSGMASLSSVSGSLMSIYSADFGNIDVKGNIQFAIDYVEQLNELHIFICQCKDLAVADIKRQRSDPYVKTYLLPEKYKLGKRKTSVKKKTFNPVYNEILRYKIEKDLLKNQSLNISVWHNDTFGRNSFLGEVELDLGTWDWNDRSNKQINWFPLKPRTSTMALNLENRGEMKLALQYVPYPSGGKKTLSTGEVHIWVKECHNLPLLRGNRLNSFIKCTILPDTSRKSRQKTRMVAKTTNPVFNHTMVYDGFRPEDLKEACVELTVWDHKQLANHFLGGLRIGLGTGKSYGTTVDWMDSTSEETALWEKMMNSPNTWIEDTLPLRMLMVAKLTK